MMKRLFSFALAMLLLAYAPAVLAEMGVQLISGPDLKAEQVSLSDLKMNANYAIPGFGEITPTSFNWVEGLDHYSEGGDAHYTYHSGEEADYALLRMDVVNTALSPKNFVENVKVRAIYDDVYEYGGWFYQYNYNHGSSWGANPKNTVILEADFFAIEPMYAGHYAFGCTLPNAIVNSKKPLRLEIQMDDLEMVYYIRK